MSYVVQRRNSTLFRNIKQFSSNITIKKGNGIVNTPSKIIKFLEENIILYRWEYVSIAFDLVGHWFVEGVFARLTKIFFFLSLTCLLGVYFYECSIKVGFGPFDDTFFETVGPRTP
jgi:hypothetical protein